MAEKAQEHTKSAKYEDPFVLVGECLYRHANSGIYYGLVKKGGKQFRRSLRTKDRKLAERALSSFRQKVGKLTTEKGVKARTFEELANDWLRQASSAMKPSSIIRKKTSLNQLNRYFGRLPVRSITNTHCDEWISKRGKNISASTFNNERETLQAVLEHALRDGLIMENPATTIKRRKLPKGRMMIPTQDQFKRLVEQIRKLDRRAAEAATLVEVLGYSGMRLAEATSMVWDDIDFERGRFVVTGGIEGTKNGEARYVPLFPAFKELLKRLEPDCEQKGMDRIVTIDTARKALTSACRKARLPNFTHHTLRHFFVSNAIEAGVDFKTIAAWVGHKDGGVLVAKTYGHLRDSHSAEMAKLMSFGLSENNG